MLTKQLVAKAKKTALEKLHALGVRDNIVIRIKPTSRGDWVGQYRARTQFTGQGRGPIFWVSETLDESLARVREEEGEAPPTEISVLNELIRTILHEYGHVIAEWAWFRNENAQKLIQETWRGFDAHMNRPWVEEDFAEDFARWLTGYNVYGNEKALDAVAALYATEVFESEE